MIYYMRSKMSSSKPSKANAVEKSLKEPTHILWITAHHGFSKSIRVLELTQQLLPVYQENNRDIDNAVFRDCIQEVLAKALKNEEDKCEELLYTLEKHKWNSSPYYLISARSTTPQHVTETATENREPTDIVNDDKKKSDSEKDENNRWLEEKAIATLRRSSRLSLSFRMEFPLGSAHSTHVVDIKPGTLVPRTQVFVQDSIKYSWELDSGKDYRQTLFKLSSQEKMAVALFRRVMGLRRIRGNLLLVDEKAGVDHVVAILSTFGTYKGGGG